MELKDWIIMIVPIIINGVLLFWFQQMMTRKIAKLDKQTEYRQKILNDYLLMLKDFYKQFNEISSTLINKSKTYNDFFNTWNECVTHLQKIVMYYNSHGFILETLSSPYLNCINKFEHMIGILKSMVTENNGESFLEFTDEESKEFFECYSEMDDLTKELLKQCEKQIMIFK